MASESKAKLRDERDAAVEAARMLHATLNKVSTKIIEMKDAIELAISHLNENHEDIDAAETILTKALEGL